MIVEFAGLPRSGKSTSIDAARDYFSRREITVRVAGEAARFCPFGNQHRVEIACWAANCALNTVLEASLDIDSQMLTLQDRGLFDALAFFRLLWKENYISRDTLSSFESYFADPRWTQHIDVVILFDVEAEVVLERDIATQIARQLNGEDLPGVITNKSTLEALQECFEEIELAFGDRFKIRPVRTSFTSPDETERMVVEIIKGELKL